ncbi:MAG TPA: hypothetical protein VNW92_27760 [Polyangiaceae bacterium]|nr:hypothetical protein [Polyangiaceae bacterium]
MSTRTLGLCLAASLWALTAQKAHAADASAATSDANAPVAPSTAPSATPGLAEPPAATPVATPPVVGAQPAGPTAAAASAADEQAPSSDSFSNEESADTEQQHRLELYGFADMTYTRLLVPSSDPWTRTYFPTNAFAVGNFNLYLSSNLGDSWRALGEVRFMYLPNGATSVDAASGNVSRTDTTVLDYAGFEQPIHWGAIVIERVWVEHEFSNLFKLQAGQFLTPYGIWNVDHGTPAIVGIRAPFAVADELFPAHQVGLQLYGNTLLDPFEVGYHFTLSNGRGPVEYENFSGDLAVGGRLYLKTDALGSLTIGGSAYRGGYYDRASKYVVTTGSNGQAGVDQQFTTIAKYQELSLGADLKWQWQRLLVQSEVIMNEANYATGGRPRVQVVAPPMGFQPDYRRWGVYGLVGYRTQLVQTMPYCMLQYIYAPDNPEIPPTLGTQFGLNIHPTPAVVLKAELSFAHFYGAGSTGLGLSPLRIIATQVAWAF